MAFPGPFLRLQVSGTGYMDEIWSYGMSIVPNFDGDPAQPTEVPAGIISALVAFHQAGGFISSAAKMTTVKLNQIGTDGRYTSASDTVLYDWPTPVAGGSTTTLPPQLAIAATLRTDNVRGRASKGRFYIPYPVSSVAADGRIPESTCQTYAGYVTTLINAINASLPTGAVGVASSVGAGAFRVVRHVHIGRTYDTIRRRRSSLPEEHVPATTAVAV